MALFETKIGVGGSLNFYFISLDVDFEKECGFKVFFTGSRVDPSWQHFETIDEALKLYTEKCSEYANTYANIIKKVKG